MPLSFLQHYADSTDRRPAGVMFAVREMVIEDDSGIRHIVAREKRAAVKLAMQPVIYRW
jgi:hypothetical protein